MGRCSKYEEEVFPLLGTDYRIEHELQWNSDDTSLFEHSARDLIDEIHTAREKHESSNPGYTDLFKLEYSR